LPFDFVCILPGVATMRSDVDADVVPLPPRRRAACAAGYRKTAYAAKGAAHRPGVLGVLARDRTATHGDHLIEEFLRDDGAAVSLVLENLRQRRCLPLHRLKRTALEALCRRVFSRVG